jgi:flagellar biosynthesis protein FlhA
VTRSTSETSLGSDVVRQVSNFNVTLIGAVIMAAMVLIPGLPKLPFLLISAILGGISYIIWQSQKKALQEPQPSIMEAPETPEDMLEMLLVDPMELEVGYAIIPLIEENGSDNLLNRITAIRRQIMLELGLVLPTVRVRDNLRLSPTSYCIKIHGEEVASGELLLDRYLAIPSSEASDGIQGTATTEPAFGLPAYWVGESEKNRAELMGYTVVTPLSVLSTHLTEVVRSCATDLLSRQMVQEMLNQLRERMPAAVDGLVPDLLSLSEVQAILRNLLRERIPIRDLGTILDVLANNATATRDPSILAEAIRQTMARTLSNKYRDQDGYLHVFTLSPQLEAVLRESLSSVDAGLGFQIEVSLAQAIINKTGEQMEKLAQSGHFPILLCPRELRLAFRRLIERSFSNLVVLAFSEVSPGTKVRAHGMVEVN